MSGNEPFTSQSQDEYYRDLLTRVDNTISQTNNTISQTNKVPGLLRSVLMEHSILSCCWHQDIENRFTRPLKIYFVVMSILFTLFLGLKLKTASGFGDWLSISILLHLVHWGQRFLFYKFQNSLILWPFSAAVAVLFFTFYDLYSLGAVGSSRARHGFGIGIAVYIFGFMLPEAIILAYRHRRTQSSLSRRADEVTGSFEEYSTL